MASFGIVFTKKDIEDRVGSEVTVAQLKALVSELEEAFEFYFERDLLSEWKVAIEEGIPEDEFAEDPSEFEVVVTQDSVGKFLYEKSTVERILEKSISDREFAFIVDFFDRAFRKYFNEECENLWADIDTIVKEYEQ